MKGGHEKKQVVLGEDCAGVAVSRRRHSESGSDPQPGDHRSDPLCLTPAVRADNGGCDSAAAALGQGEPEVEQLVADLMQDGVLLQGLLGKKEAMGVLSTLFQGL